MGTTTALLAAGCASTGTTSTGAAGATSAGTGTTTSGAAAATSTAPDEAAVSTGFGSASTPPSTAPPTAAVVYGCDQKPATKPRTYTLTCGDGGVLLDKLAWASWGKAKATATGVQIQDSCVPNCAAGAPVTTKATATLSGLSGGRYTKLHVATAKGSTDYTIGNTGPSAQ